MDNNRGSAIALVLMILAVVSLIGVGLITLARNDVKFTAALKSYDKMFGLADGACTQGFYYLATREPAPTRTGETIPIYANVDVPLIGTYTTSVTFEGQADQEPEYDADLYYPQYWNAQGTGRRLTGEMVVDAATRKIQRK